MDEKIAFRLQANKWVIIARFYYAFGILAAGFVSGLSGMGQLSLNIMVGFFSAAIVANFIFGLSYFYVRRLAARSGQSVIWLGVLQIGFEIGLLSAIFFLVPESAIIPALFLLPIIESIVLFDFAGVAWTAVWVSLGASAAAAIASYNSEFVSSYSLSLIPWSKLLALDLVYLVAGFFSANIARLVRQRVELLSGRTKEQEVKVEELERLNRSLAVSADRLAAKEFELSAANKRLQALETAKSKFVSVTTHQLRTPLSAIKWTFDMLVGGKLGPVNDDQKSFLEKGFTSTQRMISIVNDLLNVDLIEAERSDYDFQPADIEALAESVIFEFINQAESKNINLHLERSGGTLPKVALDRRQIRMALENLIDNAIKYSPAGGTVTVKILDERLNRGAGGIEIVVSDSGIGIPEAEQKKIFHKFFRGAGAITKEPDGSGLGLFIARDIIDKHHGSIWFDSQPGKGTSFHMVLPLEQPTPPLV